MSRSRPYQKNDNAWVEQKNWTHVRKVVGYRRYDTMRELALLNQVYGVLWLYKNYCQPVAKLKHKRRVGGKLQRVYDEPRTPYERLLESGQLDGKAREQLRQPNWVTMCLGGKWQAIRQFAGLTSHVSCGTSIATGLVRGNVCVATLTSGLFQCPDGKGGWIVNGNSITSAKRLALLVMALFGMASGFLRAQETLTNEAIVKMVKAGLSESTIVALIQQQPGDYSTKPADLLALKEAGVPNAVIDAMVAKASGQTVSSPKPGPTGSAPTSAANASGVPTVTEIGIYYKKGDQWVELLPEVVNWRTGGVLKSIATAGLVKGDINGVIQGPNSRNVVKTPLEFLIYAPDGVAITEYQLLRLRQNRDRREFRTVSGGVLHTSGGATRDLDPFEGKKIAPRMWTVILPNLSPGEYGFLAPGAVATQHASAQLGKMYTFRLLE